MKMVDISIGLITGVMLGFEIQYEEDCTAVVIDLLIFRTIIAWD